MSIKGTYQSPFGNKRKKARVKPLERYLASQVGHNWNTVNSELVQVLGSQTMVWGGTVRHTVENLVEINCFIASDGKAYVRRYTGYKVSGLYVHPATNVLSIQEGPKRVRNPNKSKFLLMLNKFGVNKSEHVNFRVISNDILLERKKGGWFIHTFSPYLPNDIVYYRDVYNSTTRMTEKVPMYFKNAKYYIPFRHVSCRQMGRKDLRKYKIEIAGNPY